MSTTTILSLIAVLLLAILHLAAGRLHGGANVRPTWMTAASGMSIAYVFIHLLPELAEAQKALLEARPERALYWLESQIYLAALIGVILALSLDRAVRYTRGGRFWLQIGSFAVYNALIGGAALRLKGVLSLILAVIAFGAHFLVNDHTLHVRYGRAYERIGRWVLAGSLVIGWLFAVLWPPHVVVVSAALGLVSGGIIINIIKEELPERRPGRFSPWVVGAFAYAVLMLALAYSQRA